MSSIQDIRGMFRSLLPTTSCGIHPPEFFFLVQCEPSQLPGVGGFGAVLGLVDRNTDKLPCRLAALAISFSTGILLQLLVYFTAEMLLQVAQDSARRMQAEKDFALAGMHPVAQLLALADRQGQRKAASIILTVFLLFETFACAAFMYVLVPMPWLFFGQADSGSSSFYGSSSMASG